MVVSADGAVVGVLLAAGAGRRYGKPKVLVDGWLQGAVDALRGGGCDRVVVVLGAASVPLPAGAEPVIAEDWDSGLSASVRAGLTYAAGIAGDYAVLHVIDTPDVGSAVVRRVLDRALASESGLARAVFGGQPGHPVVIAATHWAAVAEQLSGDTGAGRFLRDAPGVQNVECSDLATGDDHDYPAATVDR